MHCGHNRPASNSSRKKAPIGRAFCFPICDPLFRRRVGLESIVFRWNHPSLTLRQAQGEENDKILMLSLSKHEVSVVTSDRNLL